MVFTRYLGLVAALGIGLVACGPTAEEVTELREQQREILAKLESLEEGQQKILKARPGGARPQRPAEDFDKVHQLDLSDSPSWGSEDAPVTIVEFSDFQCPFCASTVPLLKQVKEKYGDKVRVVYKHFPLNFHPQARPAAVAAIAAQEQGKFWEMHDVLFENTRSLSEEKLPEYAKEAGLDVEKFQKDYAENKESYNERVSAEYQQGVKADVRGTPTLYINGKKLRTRSFEGMAAQIDKVLSNGS